LTYRRYLRLPERKRRYEVVDGILEMSPSPTFWHQVTQGKFFRALDDFAAAHDLGLVIPAPADVVIRTEPKLRTRQPEVLFFSDARAGFRCRQDPDRLQAVGLAPDLVLEIRSPSERPGRWAETLVDYASIGVREVGRAERTTRTVEVLVLRGDRYEPIRSGRSSCRASSCPSRPSWADAVGRRHGPGRRSARSNRSRTGRTKPGRTAPPSRLWSSASVVD
jgi:Uma2 family endonuclease